MTDQAYLVVLEVPATQTAEAAVEYAVALTMPEQVVVTVGEQGPPGAPGTASTEDYLMVANRLGELTSEQAKADARANIGLQIIDGGTFN